VPKIAELQQQADSALRAEAETHYKKGEHERGRENFAAAVIAFQEADAVYPGYKDAATLATGIELTSIAIGAIVRIQTLGKEKKYMEVIENATEVLSRVEVFNEADQFERLQEDAQELRNYKNYALMSESYRRGIIDEAMAAYDKIDPEFADRRKLRKEADRMKRVADLALEATQRTDAEVAKQVLQLEDDPENQYYQQAKAVVDKVDRALRGAEAENFLREGNGHLRVKNLRAALEAFYKARLQKSDLAEANQRHTQTAEALLQQAFAAPTEAKAAKRAIYEFVLGNSFPTDEVYVQAEKRLERLENL
jgi:hypothetical protein